MTPASKAAYFGETIQFSASVSGKGPNQTVVWSVSPNCGAIDQSGRWTAPETDATCVMTARSVVDPEKSGTATATVTSGVDSVVVKPSSPIVDISENVQFTAEVFGANPENSVEWSATCGAFNQSGEWTAPETDTTCVITARSKVDQAKAGTASATVTRMEVLAFYGMRSYPGESCGNYCEDIYTQNLQNGAVRRLTTNPRQDLEPAWSPNGQRIAFEGSGSVYVMNADGSDQVNLTASLPYAWGPTWSPDGQKIAFTYVSPSDSLAGVAVMNGDGSNVVRLVREFCGAGGCTVPGQASWSHSGNHISFASPRGGGYDIYIMNADGTNLHEAISTPGEDLQPEWLPGDTAIVFASRSALNEWTIYTARQDGSNLKVLVQGGGVNVDPTVSSDGKKLAYAKDTGSGFQIYVLNLLTGQTSQVTSAGQSRDPAWRP